MTRSFFFTTALVLAMGGCSFIHAKGPPEHIDKGSYPDCGTPRAALVGDSMVTTIAALGVIGAASDGEKETAITSAIIGGLYLGSAIWGMTRDRACDEARALAMNSLATHPLVVQPRLTIFPRRRGRLPPPASESPPADESSTTDAATNPAAAPEVPVPAPEAPPLPLVPLRVAP